MKNEGFSVVELCVALAILAIISGTALSASALGERYELERFLDSTGRLIHSTAAIALSSGAPCHITISSKANEITTQCENSSVSPKKLTVPSRFKSITAMFGSADSDQITTYESGTFSPGSLLVEHNSHACLLSLSLYGSQKVSCS